MKIINLSFFLSHEFRLFLSDSFNYFVKFKNVTVIKTTIKYIIFKTQYNFQYINWLFFNYL